jgi:nitrate reductase NapE component
LIISGWIALIVVVPFVFVSSTPELFIASLIWPLASVTDNSGVDETKTNGTTTINAIQPEIIKKSEARQAIDDVAKLFIASLIWPLASVTAWSTFAFAASFSSVVASWI